MSDEKDMDVPAQEQESEDQVQASESPEVADASAGDADAAGLEGMEGMADLAAAAEDFKTVNPDDESEEDAEAAMLRMLEDLPETDEKASPDDINFGTSQVSRAEFQQLQQPTGGTDTRNIDLLMDVDLPVSIELGRTKMTISDILSLGPGSVVELNKLAGEPVDLLVNQKIVAKGEVVVVDESFGLRITQLMTPEERLKALAEE
ncbi:MAG: flagellar motor switch protein FliN [candidate division Zixibacteria bacterium]|nr:flagellar motor switch protein FliN [candidate division Zixibacteria bacterium]